MRLEDIKVSQVNKGKSPITSGDKSMIYITYNKKTISFMYHDNYFNNSDLKSFLYALFLDAESFENSNDINNFMVTFGYYNERKAKAIFRECEKQHERLNKLFTKQEQEQVKQLIDF